jgi:hypothetical protein
MKRKTPHVPGEWILGLYAGFRDLELRCENKDQNLKYEQQESTAKTIRYENELSLNLDNNKYISLTWYDIPELVVTIRISLIECCC